MRQGARSKNTSILKTSSARHQVETSRGEAGHASRVTCLASEVVSVHQGRVSSVPDVDVVTGVEKVILLLHRSEDKDISMYCPLMVFVVKVWSRPCRRGCVGRPSSVWLVCCWRGRRPAWRGRGPGRGRGLGAGRRTGGLAPLNTFTASLLSFSDTCLCVKEEKVEDIYFPLSLTALLQISNTNWDLK